MTRSDIYILLLLIPMLSACSMSFPRDPNGTLKTVRDNILRIGIVSNSPWAYIEDGEPHGIEYGIVQGMAEELNTRIVWTQGSETEILEALEGFQLDLAIGGFIQGKHAPNHVALTLPYFSEDVVIASDEMTGLESLEGQEIYVEFGSAHILWLKDHGSIPQIIQTLTANDVPAVMTETQATVWGLSVSEHVITTRKRIMAIPPGENSWLDYVEEFLFVLSEENLAQQLIEEVRP